MAFAPTSTQNFMYLMAAKTAVSTTGLMQGLETYGGRMQFAPTNGASKGHLRKS